MGDMSIYEKLVHFFQNVGQNGPKVELFNIWHILFLILIVGLSILFYFVNRNRTMEEKTRATSGLIAALMLIYTFDFVLQPFYIGGGILDTSKLPFHLCTFIGVCLGLSKIFRKRLYVFDQAFSMIGFFAAVGYLIYPGNSIGSYRGAFSYPSFQTFLYHGLLFCYGLNVLLLGVLKPNIKRVWIDALVVLVGVSWAMLGNWVMPFGYDWYFVTGTTFTIFPAKLMPLVSYVATFGGTMILYGIYFLVVWIKNKTHPKPTLEE
jgi:hypothetical protein